MAAALHQRAQAIVYVPPARCPDRASRNAEATLRELEHDRELMRRMIEGLPGAASELVRYITPAIQRAVAKAYCGQARSSDLRNFREEVREQTQEVFCILFADGGKALRRWDAERGIPLKGYVSVIATRRTVSILRSRPRNPWWDVPTQATELDLVTTQSSDGGRVEAREVLRHAFADVRGAQTERGAALFDLMMVEDRSNDEIVAETGLKSNAVYQWRSRLLIALREKIQRIIEPEG